MHIFERTTFTTAFFTRFHNIQYNGDALQAEDKREWAQTGTLDAESVFLHPMKYDEEVGYFTSICKLFCKVCV